MADSGLELFARSGVKVEVAGGKGAEKEEDVVVVPVFKVAVRDRCFVLKDVIVSCCPVATGHMAQALPRLTSEMYNVDVLLNRWLATDDVGGEVSLRRGSRT